MLKPFTSIEHEILSAAERARLCSTVQRSPNLIVDHRSKIKGYKPYGLCHVHVLHKLTAEVHRLRDMISVPFSPIRFYLSLAGP